MKARLPKGVGGGPGNMQSMIKQAQKMQEQMTQLQTELEYTAAAGGGAVSCTVSGKREVLRLDIKPEVVDPEDVEMLSDLITAAVNEALRKAVETSEAEMNKITGGLNIPGLV